MAGRDRFARGVLAQSALPLRGSSSEHLASGLLLTPHTIHQQPYSTTGWLVSACAKRNCTQNSSRYVRHCFKKGNAGRIVVILWQLVCYLCSAMACSWRDCIHSAAHTAWQSWPCCLHTAPSPLLAHSVVASAARERLFIMILQSMCCYWIDPNQDHSGLAEIHWFCQGFRSEMAMHMPFVMCGGLSPKRICNTVACIRHPWSIQLMAAALRQLQNCACLYVWSILRTLHEQHHQHYAVRVDCPL